MGPSTVENQQLQAFFKNIHECVDKGGYTHQLHPYPAKFIPHIPRALISAYGSKGLPVLDPMCGSGTTLVEASVAGSTSIGIDLNPIAALVARAKTCRVGEPEIAELNDLCAKLVLGSSSHFEGLIPNFLNRDKWFQLSVQRELATGLGYILTLQRENSRLLALACFSAIIVGVSNQESETRWCAKPKNLPEGATLDRLARKIKKVALASHDYSRLNPASTAVIRTDARALPVSSESIGLVVTSPPYANSHDYYLYNKLRMYWLGFDVASVQEAEIGSRNRHSDRKADVDHYLSAMTEVLAETRRVLVPGGRAVFVVADSVIRKQFFDMGIHFRDIAKSVGLSTEEVFTFAHKNFNASFQKDFGTSYSKLTHVLTFLR